LLRRHWRMTGLDQPTPNRALRGARRVLRIGGVLLALFLLRELTGLSFRPARGG
jgi:hypothetical protein